MDDRELPRLPQRRERREPRVEAEETVEIDRPVVAARRLHRDPRPRAVVLALAERHDDAEAVDRTALEDRDEPLRARRGARGIRRPREERRRETEADAGERALLEEDSS